MKEVALIIQKLVHYNPKSSNYSDQVLHVYLNKKNTWFNIWLVLNKYNSFMAQESFKSHRGHRNNKKSQGLNVLATLLIYLFFLGFIQGDSSTVNNNY